MSWTDEQIRHYARGHNEPEAFREHYYPLPENGSWRLAFLELAAEVAALRKANASSSEDLAAIEAVWQPKLSCPTCEARLEPMESAPPETTGVCHGCGELLRSFSKIVEAPRTGAACPSCSTAVRTYMAVRVYTDEEAKEAHPEVLGRLREIQSAIRAAAICGCDNRGALTGECVCAGGCDCHGADNDVDVPASQVMG
ncbi:hypothetical protein LCGC14_0663190 [marine sediment metagenome]|uniref:Uncharacterized protein n=1 Tax=marine sediment metagenome TaxID=412755 RepID=A0A0F9TED2_9ZZZZ